MTLRWAIVTGEYPPQAGGVADYTALVACALAEAGDAVTVYAPPGSASTDTSGVKVVALPDHFGPRGLLALRRALGGNDRPDRLLVQYVPHMYGCKGMNLPLCLWLRHACPARPWVMFHEVALPVVAGQPLRHRAMALVQRQMAALAARAAEQVFVSTPAWVPTLAQLAPGVRPIWLPVPSNLPHAVATGAADFIRRSLGEDRVIVGHFGAFAPAVTALLEDVLPLLLRAGERRFGLLIGLGSESFAERLLARHPDLGGRLRATGVLPATAVAAHLAACDLLLQPFPDGVSTRRTSLMAGLALGRAIVTTHGELTEPLWPQSGALALTPAGDAAALRDAAESLLADARQRDEFAARGHAFYADRFAPPRLIAALRQEILPHGYVA